MGKQRDCYVDFLRGFGLLLLFLAHSSAPHGLAEARCFDVPLMVMISAYCFNASKYTSVWQYVVSRFKRIYYPCFVFLTIFFVVCSLKPHWLPTLSVGKVVASYLLLNKFGIEFIWIMRIFLMMALVLPLLYKLAKRCTLANFCLLIIVLTGFQQLVCASINAISSEILRETLSQTIPYVLGYSTFAILGLKLRDFNQKDVIIIAVISALATVVFMLCNGEFNPNFYKYPPRLMFIAYGMFGCSIMWLLRPCFSRIADAKFFRYLSDNSMWIYLWHIFPGYFVAFSGMLPDSWVIRYVVLLLGGVGLNLLADWVRRLIVCRGKSGADSAR